MASYDDTATVSGSVISISDGADELGLKSFAVSLPISLTGYTEVNGAQSGKNLYDIDGKVYNGEFYDASGNVVQYADCAVSWIKVNHSTKYSFSCTKDTAQTVNVRIAWCKSDKSFISRQGLFSDNQFPMTLTTPNNCEWIQLSVNQYGAALIAQNNWSIQVEQSETSTTFEAYTGTQYTASLGRTIYGGTADVVTGEGTDGYSGIVALNSLTWTATTIGGNACFFADLPNGYMGEGSAILDGACSSYAVTTDGNMGTNQTIRFYYNSNYNFSRVCIRDDQYASYTGAQFKEAVTGNIVYQLADNAFTPFTFAPVVVETEKGSNTFWSDQGNVEVTYYKDGYGFTSVTVNNIEKNWCNISNDTYGNSQRCNYTYENNGITIEATGTYARIGFIIPLKKGYTYTLSYKGKSTSEYRRVLLYRDTLWTGAISSQNLTDTEESYSYTFTPTNDYVCLGFYVTATTTDGVTNISDVMIEEGSQATEYEPYEAESKIAKFHKIVYGGLVDVIQGKAEPKNILLPSNTDSASTVVNGVARSYSLDSQTWTLEGTNEKTDANWLIYNGANFVVSKELVVGDTYTYSHTLSANCYSQFTYKDTNGTTRALGYLVGNADKNASVTFTVPSNFVELLRFQIGIVKTATSVSEEAVFQLEKASSKTEYAPYFVPFTFPPISMGTDEGANTLFANEGNSQVTYRKEQT